MNKITLIGNLTKDPEIRSTSTGKKVAAFSLAINEGKDQNGKDLVSYFNLTAWDKKAEILELYVKKGHKIAVIGKLSINTWEKPDGTKSYSPEIIVSEIELLTSRMEAERINANVSNSSQNSGANYSQPAYSQPQNSQNSSKPAPKTENTEEVAKGNNAIPEIDINDMDFNVQMPF